MDLTTVLYANFEFTEINISQFGLIVHAETESRPEAITVKHFREVIELGPSYFEKAEEGVPSGSSNKVIPAPSGQIPVRLLLQDGRALVIFMGRSMYEDMRYQIEIYTKIDRMMNELNIA